MSEKTKTPRTEHVKEKKGKEEPRQIHTPEGPAEEFINEYSKPNPPPPLRKK